MKESYENGKRIQKTISKIAWPALGFTDSMSLEQARARAHQLNQQGAVERAEARSVARIAERVDRDRLHHSAFVPEDLNLAFLKHLEVNVTGSEIHLEKLKMTWATAKKMIISLKLTTEFFSENKKQFYRYLANQEYSLDYSKKILRMVNLYGRFCAKLTGKYFEQVPNPRGHDRELINDSYFESDSFVGASEPLTLDLLESLREQLPPEQHSWLRVSVWFGLRPSEIDQILADRNTKHWRIEPGDPDVLWVYQPKLTSKPREQRWKGIPVLYKEQQEALSVLFEGKAAKPLTKTLKSKTGMHTTLYAGRKGFTDLMLDKGQSLDHISQWLGHSTTQMTLTRYKDKRRVQFTLVK